MEMGADLPVEVQLIGDGYGPEEIGFVPSTGRFSGGGVSSLANLAQQRQEVVQFAKNIHSYGHDISATIRARRALGRLGGNPHGISEEELIKRLPDDFIFAIDDIDISTGLAHVFMAHRFKILEALERGTPGQDGQGKALGPAPWDVVNETLQVAGFPYEVISPTQTKIIDHYELRLRDIGTGVEIPMRDLSSGEQVLLQLVLWLFTAGKSGAFPRLLLLDEPDAHLHPSMTTQFLDVISEVLVNRHGVRVVMTTHSPSTVALAPESSIFQMERGASVVMKVNDRAGIISVLTAGLVTVSPASKFIFVEDEDDVAFYDAVYAVLSDHGPSRDPMALRPAPSMAFIPASVGAGAAKIAGGSSIVEKWVGKLDAEPLLGTFCGIIDRDSGNVGDSRVHVIGRYSFENYLLDPLNVFCLLLEDGTAPSVAGIQISSGDEHLLRLQPDNVLQAISDVITGRMEAKAPALATSASVNVTYSVGKQIVVPSWVVDYRGHDLLPIAQSVFGSPRTVTPPRLIRALRRGRLLPSELATLLATIQLS